MKSCQTEETYFASQPTATNDIQPEESKKLDVSLQTVCSALDAVDAEIQTEAETQEDLMTKSIGSVPLQQARQIETSTLSTQTEESLKNEICNVQDAETQSEECKEPQGISTGIQCTSETVVKSCQTQILTQSHTVQTDLTSANSHIQPKKVVKDIPCQTSALGRQAAVQTDVQEDPSPRKSPDGQQEASPSISVHDITSALEPVLLNFSNDVKTLITDTFDVNQTSALENISQCLIREIQNIGSSLETSLQQASSLQCEDTQQKFSSAMDRIEDSLRSRLETTAQLLQSRERNNSGEIQEVLEKVNSSLVTRFEEVRNDLNKIQRQRESTEQDVLEKLDSSFRNLKENNDYSLKSLSDSIKTSKDYNMHAIETLKDDLMPKFAEMKRAIAANQPEDSGISESLNRDITDKLGKMERSLVSSFEKSLSNQDLSGVEHEVHRMSEELQRKISALQHGLQSVDSGSRLDLTEVDADLKSIRESNKQVMSLLKARSSEANTNLSEALEENFLILQDNLRRLQQTLVQRINEVSQHANIAEDQKLSWLSKQITEMATQVAGMQTGLMRMQSSLEASQSLPSASGILDESLISSLKASNEQAVSSLKFQNQSMIQLLESLQKDIHSFMHQKPIVKDGPEVQLLKDSLHNKELELDRLSSSQEKLQEKVRFQVSADFSSQIMN